MSVPAPPPLPNVGDLDWGPEVNAALVWLYEQHVLNLAAIEANRSDITTLTAQVTDLAAQIATVQPQIDAVESRISTLENAPVYVYNSTPWMFSNGTPPATGSQIKLNNTNPSLATLIDARKIDADGADRSPWFQMVAPGAIIQISDWNNSTTYHRFRATGMATFDATNVQVPVTWVVGLGTIPNAKANVGFLVNIKPILG